MHRLRAILFAVVLSSPGLAAANPAPPWWSALEPPATNPSSRPATGPSDEKLAGVVIGIGASAVALVSGLWIARRGNR